MRKVGDKDFEEMSGRLRARAVELMEALEHPGADSRDAKSAPGCRPERDDEKDFRCPSLRHCDRRRRPFRAKPAERSCKRAASLCFSWSSSWPKSDAGSASAVWRPSACV
jgi:hypothetical protein